MTSGYTVNTSRKIHTLRIEITGSPMPIWRTFEVDGSITLGQLHELLQVIMGWEDKHLHAFLSRSPYDEMTRGGAPMISWQMEDSIAEGIEGINEDEVTVSEALQQTDGQLWYEYDFGDDWLHLISLQKTREAEPDEPVVRILAGENAAPPEDCGGISGFAGLHETLAGQTSEARADIEHWLKASRTPWNPYRPGEYDFETKNLELAFICRVEAIGGKSPNPPGTKLNRLGTFVFTNAHQGEPEGIRVFLAARLSAAGLDPLAIPVQATAPEDVEKLMGRYQWIIREALDGGIKLTPAGWMSPAVVKKAYEEIDFGRELYFWEPVSSESKSHDIDALRSSAVGMGLLKIDGKKIVATAAGKRLADEPAGLWKHIVSRAMEPTLKGDEYDATLLMVMAAALGPEHGPDLLDGDAVLRGMSWIGYRNADYSEISKWWSLRISERLLNVMLQLGLGNPGGFHGTPAAVDFARAVLRA